MNHSGEKGGAMTELDRKSSLTKFDKKSEDRFNRIVGMVHVYRSSTHLEFIEKLCGAKPAADKAA